MKVIMIGTDRKLFEPGSAVRERMSDYGARLTELHIIVFAGSSLKLKPEQLSDKVWIYPTNSLSKFLYIFDAIRIGKRIVRDRFMTPAELLISAQDPFETGFAALSLKTYFSAKLQLQIHTDFLDRYFAKGSILNRLRVMMARRILPKADGIRAVSQRIARSLSVLDIAPSKIGVLPIYTDPARFQAPPTKDLRQAYPQFSFIILAASRLVREKNIPLALRVFAEIVKAYPETGLVLVGDGPEKARLEKLAKKLHIEKSVAFEPWQKDLVSYYKTCNAFLLTSNYEGYGLTLVEAGLSGAAIVTTDVGIAGELFKDGENAYVCPVGGKECLVAKLSDLIDDPNRLKVFKASVAPDVRAALTADKQAYLERYQALLEKAKAS